ncbi:hypothetical protein [Pseudomonas savastanoi]|uniref:hypothetical protein n=1 Tax=Pseudomonas savastanoi TaxID=29438 RepID=UPI000EFEC6AA|nr:hypothetical protein [Pseudomonas savastanoi]
MKLNCTFSKIKFAALAGLTVISLQAPLVHADDGANIGGSQNQGDPTAIRGGGGSANAGGGGGGANAGGGGGANAGPQPSTCCTPTACITPCP